MKFSSTAQSNVALCIIGLLCLGIAMQVLGAPISLWDTQSVGDHFSASVLEGFSLPTEMPLLLASFRISLMTSLTRAVFLPILINSQLRPPRTNH